MEEPWHPGVVLREELLASDGQAFYLGWPVTGHPLTGRH